LTAALYDILVKDRLLARKKRDLLMGNLLTVLVSDIEKVAKDDGNREPTEEDAILTIRKFLKGVKQNLELRPDDEGMQVELSILEFYLPPQMSENQILEVLTQQNFLNIGSAMSFFKMNHAGEYDNAMLSKIVREYLGKK
jgi:uncharacterized protein YqeY